MSELNGEPQGYFHKHSRPYSATCLEDEEWLLKLANLAQIKKQNGDDAAVHGGCACPLTARAPLTWSKYGMSSKAHQCFSSCACFMKVNGKNDVAFDEIY